MKKLLTVLLSLCLITGVCAFTSCESTGEKEKLVLGFDADFPPFGYEENGQFVGFDIEFARKVIGNLGYELELRPIDWDAKDALLLTGAIDFIWNGFTYEGRENDYEWTVRYLDNSIVALTATEGVNSLADLAGKKVAVQSDSSGEAALEKNGELTKSFDGGKFYTEPEYNTACKKLTAGAYDAIIVDAGVAAYLVKNDSSLKIIPDAVASETYAVGFKKGNAELCEKVSAEMEKVGKDETFIKGLCEKYGVDYNAFLLK
ncbi:MAG: transporter substrate-binding domain-containing protein [Clostridia bacterium]|nr:transporter substrate-binding domain-containing protein [Clostridia bacterium]